MSRVTTLIANNNYGRYIEQAIKSCQSQTYQGKIIVVDDASIDNSWQIIYDTLNFSKPIVQEANYGTVIHSGSGDIIVRLNNKVGPSFARNIGISLTHQDTDFYQILDADDYMYNNKIERMLSKFKENETIGVVYADYDIFNVELKTLIREYKEPFSYQRLLSECIVHSGAMIKKQALLDVAENTGFYDINLRCAEDYDLWLRIAEKYQICHIPESLTYVRVHQANSTNSVSKEIWDQCRTRLSLKFQARQNNDNKN